MAELRDQVAIVTGAGSGIGAALAKKLSQEGAKVLLNARRRERLKQVGKACEGPTLIVAGDVTDPKGRKALVNAALSAWGRIDILVNNAGLGFYGHFLDTVEEDWRRIFEVNLFAPVLLTQLVLPVMLRQGRGTILQIASIAGLISHSDRVSPYVASKHALIGFSRALRKDLVGRDIRVLAACPHLTDTELFSSSPGASDMATEIEKFKGFMDSAEAVAQGILDQWDSERLIVFPTSRPEKAYQKQRDL